jgi:hypothetical protein
MNGEIIDERKRRGITERHFLMAGRRERKSIMLLA